MEHICITESDMTFGEYNTEDIFHIENSNEYKKHLQNHGIKTVEFVLLKENTLIFLEAKKTTPNPGRRESSAEKLKKYSEYVEDIVQKFSDSLSAYMSMYVGRLGNTEITEKLKSQNYNELKFVLVVVVKNGYIESLIHYKEKFERELKKDMELWNIHDIIVLDEARAKKKGLITASTQE